MRLVSLSATVSNAEEFGDWLDTVRGDTEVVVEEHRPVPLWQHVLVGDRLYDLFVDDGDAGAASTPSWCELGRTSGASERATPRPRRARRAPAAPRRRGAAAAGAAGRSRADVIERLERDGPAAGDHLHLQPGRLRRRRRSSACAAGCG